MTFNDVTARDLTRKDPQFTRGKGLFGPLDPVYGDTFQHYWSVYTRHVYQDN